MAFKLSKSELERKEKLSAKLQAAREDLEQEQDDLNETLSSLYEDFNEKVRAYNEAAEEAKDFAEGVASEAQSELDEHEDHENAAEIEDWISQWSDFAPDELDELEPPDHDVLGNDSAVDDFECLPDEPEV